MKNLSTAIRIPELLLLLLLAVPGLGRAETARIFELSADDWARPRSGAVVAQMEPVRLAVSYWDSTPRAAIMLSYPGEDSGELWASELRDWMISLGVPSDAILLAPGLQSGDRLRLLVGAREELNP